ncbi:MAG TPA: twin-arginine translocase TatA/TatE family subunit [Solirubrobacteraceae bacterium]|nr:twin-arginine translocase TatA/TatE family subunit [Solirubrobacteraceae bacterium]
MPSIGPLELIVVLAIALVILGPKRLPDAARSLGSGLRGFKESLTGGSDGERQVAIEQTGSGEQHGAGSNATAVQSGTR